MNETQKMIYNNSSDIFNLKPPKTINNFQKENFIKKPIIRIEKKNKNLEQGKRLTPLRFKYNKNEDHLDYLKTEKSPFQNLNKSFIIKRKNNIIDDKDEDRKEDYLKIKEKNARNNFKLGDDKTYFKTTNNINQELIQKRYQKMKKEQKLKPKEEIDNKNLTYRKIKPAPLTQKNTAGTKFDINSSKKTNFQYFKSNIFHDPKKDIFNKTFQPKLNNEKEKKNNIKIPIKKEKIKNQDPLIPKKLDWTDKVDFIKTNNKMNNLNAKERNLYFNKGSFPSKFSDYKHDKKDDDLNKSMDNLMVKRHEKYIGITEKQRESDNFEINNINFNSGFNMNDIKKEFRNNGFHIYGDKINCEFFNGKERGQAKFSIRKDVNDKDYEKKIKKVEEILEKKQGIKISKIKESNDKVVKLDKNKNVNNKTNWLKNKIKCMKSITPEKTKKK